MNHLKLKVLIEGSLSIALGVVLGYLPLFEMPQGGNVSLAILPILVFALRNGYRKGVMVGLLYALLSFILGPKYSLHLLSILLDYLVPGAVLGLIPWKKWYVGLGFITLVRFASYVTSGAIVFASYAGSQNPWIYSMVYNSTYLIPETIIIGAILAILLNGKKWNRLFNK